MIDLSKPNEWQHIDPETGVVFPWYTKSFLDELATWDLRDKVVFEYGCGASTLWWAQKTNRNYGVENEPNIFEQIKDTGVIFFAAMKGTFIKFLTRATPCDIIIVDSEPVEWRDDCIAKAVESLVPGGRLIIDNWDQPSVWVPSEETRKLLAPYPCKIYKQDGHPDWQTAVFTV